MWMEIEMIGPVTIMTKEMLTEDINTSFGLQTGITIADLLQSPYVTHNYVEQKTWDHEQILE